MRLTEVVPVLMAGWCAGAALAAPPVVDFEDFGAQASFEGATVGDEYWDSHGVRFRNTEPGHALALAKVGAPFRAFRGYLGSADFPYPGARVGQYFLTDSHFGTGSAPGPFILEYRWPTATVSGVFIDVNEQESWRAEAFDAAGVSRGSVEVFPTTLPGVAISWSLQTDAPVITKVIMTFTGIAPPGGVTFALDDIGGSEPVCGADLNGDGLVDFSDYLDFLSGYSTFSPIADLNDDGLVDFQDYLEFLSYFDTGC
ncbi:MAG: EF-hand domain-containing protein [Phycisphaerales bacterium]|nr:EF-hand domain-containing protein [Phycisphaerales bacterium]